MAYPRRGDSLRSGLGAALGAPPSLSEDEAPQSMRIRLQLEAKRLPNLDKRGKSDPFAILYRKAERAEADGNEWVRVGQTETVYNNLNPKWSATFAMDYCFGANFVLKFDLYDRDSRDEDLRNHDYIGEVRCTIAQIVLADNQCLTMPVTNPKGNPGQRLGSLTIRGEEIKSDLGDSVTFQFGVTGLRRGKKPFYVLSRKNRNDDAFSPVSYSEVHQSYRGGTLVSFFKPLTKSLLTLVNGDMDRRLQIEFMDYDRRGSHYRGGRAVFTLRSARAAVSSGSLARFELVKRKTNGYVVGAGTLILKRCDISVPFSFLDYIQAGVIINLVVAVDMSSTNGNPADPGSLHHNNPSAPNEYVIALREVGNVLAAYDTSKSFPAFGFSANLPPHFANIDHCFALTGDISQPVCRGVEDVVEMYYHALRNVAPHQPCLYGPVLDQVIRLTRAADEPDDRTVYTVLLLVTDGDFVDFADVANLICSAADLPLSIVIVGVGNSTFVQLERLDGDDHPLCSSNGTPCSRDIVQFVPFHQFRYNPTKLAREVLDEIPDQMVSYMRSKGIKPTDIVPFTREPAPNSFASHGPISGPYVPVHPPPTPIIPQQHQSPMQPMPPGPQAPYGYQDSPSPPMTHYSSMPAPHSTDNQPPMHHGVSYNGQPQAFNQGSSYSSSLLHGQTYSPQQYRSQGHPQ